MDIDTHEKLELYWTSLTDPYLAIGGGPCRPEHKIAGGAPISKKIFSAIRASAWSENKGGGGGGGPPGLFPRIHSWTLLGYCNDQVYATQEVLKLELYSDIIRLL